MFGRGDLSRVIFDALRNEPNGLDIKALSEIVMRAKGFDLADAIQGRGHKP
jgi:hypothetical protein